MKITFILALSLLSSLALGQETCGEIMGPAAYNFCIAKTPGSSSTDVLFYLHGGGGDEHEGKKVIERLSHDWKTYKHEAPIVVTISFGKLWLLIGRNSSPRSGLLEVFLDSIVPEMEKRALGGPARRRLLVGYSMGGFNSAQVLFRAPPRFFAKAALVCPAIIDLSPWASEKTFVDHAEYLGVPVESLQNLTGIIRNFVSEEIFYNQQVDPIALAKTHLKKVETSLLIAVNVDDLKFRDGGEKFSKAARTEAVPVTLQVWTGNHCKTDTAQLAEFLR